MLKRLIFLARTPGNRRSNVLNTRGSGSVTGPVSLIFEHYTPTRRNIGDKRRRSVRNPPRVC